MHVEAGACQVPRCYSTEYSVHCGRAAVRYLGPLQERYVLLRAEPSLQTPENTLEFASPLDVDLGGLEPQEQG